MKAVTKIMWECPECKDEQISRSDRKWDMQVCKCKKTGLDLEEHYSRTMGEPTIIKEEKIEVCEYCNLEGGNHKMDCDSRRKVI